MGRADWGYNGGRGKCSYKRTTLIICSINIAVALYVLHSLYISLYDYPYNDSQKAAKYTPDQQKKMEESIRIRKASEPTKLIEVVKQMKETFLMEEKKDDLPLHLKRRITDEILQTLRGLDANASATKQREAVEHWRMEKLKEATRLIEGKKLNSTILLEEAGLLSRALKSNWAELSEEIGLWIPVEIVNKEHDDKPEGGEDFATDILPGRQLPPECHTELHTDYDGAAVRWGLTHHKESAYDCCQACLDHAKNAKPNENKCNIWVYCPLEEGCYSPDIYEHKSGECWLKHAEKPKVNFKNKYSDSFRNSHSNVPVIVPWVSGIVSV
ncbi:hypothetical protein LguiB_017273 [Lonicera macranthoides]